MGAWPYLLMAILLEVCGTTSMKLSAGFTKLLPSILIFVFYSLSFTALTICLKHMDVSVAYAVWSGLGTLLIAIIGAVYFKESMTLMKAVSIALIIIGVIGVNLSGTNH
jgi:small multidrug resistance pump